MNIAYLHRVKSSGFGAMMTWALGASCVLLVVVALVAGLTGGVAQLASAVIGVALTTLFFASGAWGLRLLMTTSISANTLIGALAIYAAQLLGLLALYELLRSASWLQGAPLAWGALSATITWQCAQVWGLSRSRQLLYGDLAPFGAPTQQGAVR